LPAFRCSADGERWRRREDGTAVCRIAALLAEPIVATGRFTPSNAFASGCHVAEVEIDPQTGITIDHTAATAQIHGGIAQGVGEVLGEEAVIDADGQALAGSLMDYTRPRADDLPAYTVLECNTPSPFNPIGVKGIGAGERVGRCTVAADAVHSAASVAGAAGLERDDRRRNRREVGITR
jgi:carbon-monoxide dehydrogenase large subunit